MSMVGEILEELWNTDLNFKGIRVNIFGIPRFNKYSKRSVQMTLYRLEKRGIIRKEIAGIILSKKGKDYVKRKIDSLRQFDKNVNANKNKDLLIMFDVPVERKGEREWFRRHLKKFGFIMIQHSVWIGPSPLSDDFIKYLKTIKLDKCIRTFKLAKSYKGN